MGNADSSSETLNPSQKISAVLSSPNYPAVKRRIEKLGIQLTFQGDGSLQLQNPKDLVRGNRNIPGPQTIDGVEVTIKKLIATLDEWMGEFGYISYQ